VFNADDVLSAESRMRAELEKLLRSRRNTKPVQVEATGWLHDKSSAELKTIYREFRGMLESRKTEVVDLLGAPTRQFPADRDWFGRWYPECLHGVAWERNDKVICLAVEQFDREAPVSLVLRCLTWKEFEDLSA
jgi:hypothetical protein